MSVPLPRLLFVLVLGLTSLALPAGGSDAVGQLPPSGQRLISNMLRAVWSKGTFHVRMEAIGQSKDVREVLTQDLDEDLRHHLLHQRATDRTTWLHYPPQRAQQYRQCLQRSRRARLRRAACRGLARTFLDWFERTSVGYNAATRSNTGKGTWQCQHFKPGQVHLIGRKSYLADLGWPRHARNLGPTMLAGVPVWHVRATVFGGPPQGGGAEPPTRADFYIARSDNTLLREATATTAFGFGPKSRNTRYWMYSRYGQPVHVSLPSACRARP